jgi:hypothetical protein
LPAISCKENRDINNEQHTVTERKHRKLKVKEQLGLHQKLGAWTRCTVILFWLKIQIVADITTWKVYNMNNKNTQRDDTDSGNPEGYAVPPL